MPTTITDVPADRQAARSSPGLTRTLAVLASTLMISAAGVTVTATGAQAAIIPGRCEHTNREPVLRQGSSGTAVRQLQCELNWALPTPDITVDGQFGAVTARVVQEFQYCATISTNGIVGANTWRELNRWARSADYCER